MGRARDLANILSSSGNVALDSEMGLTLITPTSIAATGGSGTISTTGAVSFTSASAISLNGVFSSNYENYKVLLRVTSISADQAIYMKMRVSGVDSSASYYYIGYGASGTSTVYTNGGNNQTTGHFIGNTDGASNNPFYGWDIQIFDPFVAKPTPAIINYVGIAQSGALYGMTTIGWQDTFSSRDGISIISSTGTFTGTISVYGYRK
jgi:hypothetical protein